MPVTHSPSKRVAAGSNPAGVASVSAKLGHHCTKTYQREDPQRDANTRYRASRRGHGGSSDVRPMPAGGRRRGVETKNPGGGRGFVRMVRLERKGGGFCQRPLTVITGGAKRSGGRAAANAGAKAAADGDPAAVTCAVSMALPASPVAPGGVQR